ncbi:DUF5696 domain-containing protein [Petrotoga sp. 9PW.55.5.1]|uniref:DUF5696 domain-containing protein n=1 Tax=Petrotoga sp. 9PW.55.5.1 TaxID=1308979 RepID=UPI000DDB440E|nr:DUF5696 domain-containing protein [Petrotoga sp. 9PW.55.5.1]
MNRKLLILMEMFFLCILSGLIFPQISDKLEFQDDTVLEKNEISNIGSNRYTKPENSVHFVTNKLDLNGYEKILEDDYVEIYYKDKNASIRIVNKNNNYIWGGLPSEKPSDMNTTWSGIGNSLVSIDYFDKAGIERKTSIAANDVVRDYRILEDKVLFSIIFERLKISFDFSMKLEKGTLIFNLDSESIREEGDYMLAAIYFFPFLGTVRGDEIEGYMFIPDGPGALIRFDEPFKYLSPFEKRIYGKDYAIDHLYEVNDLRVSRPNDFATEEKTVLMPIFGMVHGPKQNAFFAQVTQGEEYASILATPAGILTNYNWVSAKFIYRQKYLQPTSRSGGGVQVVQPNKNEFMAEIRYYFLSDEDADYVGMAKLYRNILEVEGILNSSERIDSQIPLHISILGSDLEKGFISNNVKRITSAKQMEDILQDLCSYGIYNLTLVLKGWQKGGINGSKISEFNFEKLLGDKEEILAISDLVEKNGGRFYFYENPVSATEFQIDFRQDGAHSLSQDLIKLQRDNEYIWIKDRYLVRIDKVVEYLEKKATLYIVNNMKNMAIDELGSKLYAENQRRSIVTRSEAKKMIDNSMPNILKDLENLAIFTPNQYLWKYSSEIFHIPMVNSQYIYETDTVPFIQIVLKGKIDYYAPYSNMGFYSPTDVLKLIEYGAYPSFIISATKNDELKYTPVADNYYSTNYEDWVDIIIDTYNTVNEALSKVEGKQIMNRTVLEEGIIKVDYEGNISIILNYTSYDYFFEGQVVKSLDFLIFS